ncbi:hypothetical protein ACXHXG_18030 [Rhizobium sp. LEGMi198b]|nr:hypothetical protein [Rhizobium sp. CNPSo 3464]MDK4739583.1 hypothetical protein [Rhizobium sp. CNPSo 3464]
MPALAALVDCLTISPHPLDARGPPGLAGATSSVPTTAGMIWLPEP